MTSLQNSNLPVNIKLSVYIGFMHIQIGSLHASTCLQGDRTAKAQIDLRICAGRFGPLLSAYKVIGYYIILEWRAKARVILCVVQGDLNLCIFYMFEGTFPLDAAQLFIYLFFFNTDNQI